MKSYTLLSVIATLFTSKALAGGCFAEDLGFKCCSYSTMEVYSDSNGKWSVESGEWCGIDPNASSCWANALGYRCCKSSQEVIATDKDGEWSVEDGHWCGIPKDNEPAPISSATGDDQNNQSSQDNGNTTTDTPSDNGNTQSDGGNGGNGGGFPGFGGGDGGNGGGFPGFGGNGGFPGFGGGDGGNGGGFPGFGGNGGFPGFGGGDGGNGGGFPGFGGNGGFPGFGGGDGGNGGGFPGFGGNGGGFPGFGGGDGGNGGGFPGFGGNGGGFPGFGGGDGGNGGGFPGFGGGDNGGNGGFPGFGGGDNGNGGNNGGDNSNTTPPTDNGNTTTPPTTGDDSSNTTPPTDNGNTTTPPTTGGSTGGSVDCSGKTLKSGTTLSIGGRKVIVKFPNGFSGDKPAPLLINYHPIMGSASQWESGSQTAKAALNDGAIVAFMDGAQGPMGQAWNVGPCCTDADDVSFTRNFIKEITSKACVDPKRIYAAGFSMGGGMSNYAGCFLADVIAAAAPSAFDLAKEIVDGGKCKPARAFPILNFRGTQDNVVAYNGGLSQVVQGKPITFMGAKNNLKEWAKMNGCTGEPKANTPGNNCEMYENCKDGVKVGLCTINGGGHSEGDGKMGWDFVKQFTLP